MIPLLKKGKKAESVDSYRPISLLPCLSKIFECAIKDVILDHFEEENILPEDQFSSRSRRSTIHPLVILQDDVVTNLNKKTPTVAMDIAKAFDTTWIEGLIHKLLIFGFSHPICRIIFNYLTNRKFFVLIGGMKSDYFDVAAGVPQGGVLSAILFVIYIADMPLPPNHAQQIKRLQFADDTLIYVSARNVLNANVRLNSYIKDILAYQEKWKIKCSEDKCEAIILKGPVKRYCKKLKQAFKKVKVAIGRNRLLPQDTLKYLGITFSSKCTFVCHVSNIIAKAKASVHALGSILRKRYALSARIKRLCYLQLVRPIITYGFPCWSSISSAQMEKLRIAERKCLRLCTNYRRPRHSYHHIPNSVLYQNAQIQRIDRVLVDQQYKFFGRIDANTMPSFNSVMNHDIQQMEQDVFKPPSYLEHLRRADKLYHGDLLTHYHRRYRPSQDNIDHLVYNLRQ